MEVTMARDLVKVLESLLAYAEQLSGVFNSHALMRNHIPSVIRSHMTILGATIAPLKQVLTLLKDEADGEGNCLFSQEGLEFVNISVRECAVSLGKIVPTTAQATVKSDSKSKHKRVKKPKPSSIVSPADLKLDERELSNDLESAKWHRVDQVTDDYLDRLHDIQVRLLLICQVITLGTLSRDMSSGKVDVQAIVTHHERTSRTADLAGISSGYSINRRRRRSLSSGYSSSSSDSDSDTDSDISLVEPPYHGPPQAFRRQGPPPPPPPPGPRPPINTVCPHPVPPSTLPRLPPSVIGPQRPISPLGLRSISPPPPQLSSSDTNRDIKPPSYESHKIDAPTIFKEKAQDLKGPIVANAEESTVEAIQGWKAPDNNLFRSRHNGLGFKIKSIFRSKESLAAEMKHVLENTQCVLKAFKIEGNSLNQIPHSALHSLEATHMRTILGQLNNNSWFKTYSQLIQSEHDALRRAQIYPCPPGVDIKPREVVVLKFLHENKFNAWMRLLTQRFGAEYIFPHHANARVILAIVREQSSENSSSPTNGHPRPRLVGPSPLQSSTPTRSPTMILAPPIKRPRIHDLKCETNLHPVGPMFQGGFHSSSVRLNFHLSGFSGQRIPFNDADAAVALTTYTEYTLRIAEPASPREIPSWSRVIVTQESNSMPDILARIQRFSRSNDIIDATLRLSDWQSRQLAHLLAEMRVSDLDHKFEWCWVELSLFDSNGELSCMANTALKANAHAMHLIAKRSLKREYSPVNVLNHMISLAKSPPPPPPPPPMHLPPMHLPPPPPAFINVPKHRRAKSSSGSELSDSDAGYSSDTSSGRVTRRTRKRRMQSRRRYNGSDSEDSDDEEDVLKIDLRLKRGDDVVNKLLERWTPNSGAEK